MRNDPAREKRVPPAALGGQISRRNVLKGTAAQFLGGDGQPAVMLGSTWLEN